MIPLIPQEPLSLCLCVNVMVIKCVWTFFPGSGPVSSDRPEQSREGVSPNHSKLLWTGNVWQGQSETRPGQGYSSGHQQKGQHQWGEYIVPILEHWGAYAFAPRTRQMALWIPDQSGISSETISEKQKRSLLGLIDWLIDFWKLFLGSFFTIWVSPPQHR